MSNEKGSPDRVWFSDGLKLNMGDYESVSVDAGMSSDVRPGETAAQAFERVRKQVQGEVAAQAKRVRKGLYKEVLG